MTREDIRRILDENAVTSLENQGLHSWRCQYPEQYGACHCVEGLIEDLFEASQPEPDLRPIVFGIVVIALIGLVAMVWVR